MEWEVDSNAAVGNGGLRVSWYRVDGRDRAFNMGCTCMLGKTQFRMHGSSFCEHVEDVLKQRIDTLGPWGFPGHVAHADPARIEIPLFGMEYLRKIGYSTPRGQPPPRILVDLEPIDHRLEMRHVTTSVPNIEEPVDMGYVSPDDCRMSVRQMFIGAVLPYVVDARCLRCGTKCINSPPKSAGVWAAEMVLLAAHTLADPDGHCWRCSLNDLIPQRI